MYEMTRSIPHTTAHTHAHHHHHEKHPLRTRATVEAVASTSTTNTEVHFAALSFFTVITLFAEADLCYC